MGKPLPTKAGWYWAKSGDYKWHNLIVRVNGEPPFLSCSALNMGGLRDPVWVASVDVGEIKEWGPEIQDPDEDKP